MEFIFHDIYIFDIVNVHMIFHIVDQTSQTLT